MSAGPRFTPTDDLADLRAVLADGDLSTSERILRVALLLHRNGQSGTCNPSISTLADESGLGYSTVIRVLGQLVDQGWIRRHQQSGVRSHYDMLTPLGARRVPEPDPSRSERGPVPEREGTPLGARAERTNKRTNERTLFSRDESLERERDGRDFPPLSKLRKEGRRRLYPAPFEGAFAALPARDRPHPKADTYRAWRARVREVEELFQLEAAADAYREDCEQNGKVGSEFVMLGSTFFGPGARFESYLNIQPGAAGSEDWATEEVARFQALVSAGARDDEATAPRSAPPESPPLDSLLEAISGPLIDRKHGGES